MAPSEKLALNSTETCEALSISKSCLQKLVREKKLTPLLHIKKNYQIYAKEEIDNLLKNK